MAIQKFQTSLVKTVDGTQYVGENNRLFFDLPTRTFRLSDEVTPGGIVIGSGGGGSNTEFTEKFTLKSDETTDPVQTQFYIYYGTTTDASTTRLYKDSSNTSIEVPQQTTMFFEVDIIGRNDTTPDYGAFKVKGVIDKNNNGDTSIIMNQKEIMHAGANELFDANVVADNALDLLAVEVNGEAATNIRWSALVKVVSVKQT